MKNVNSNVPKRPSAKNDAVRDKQEISTAYIIVPVLAVGNMDYAAFETSPDQKVPIVVNYSEEAVSDPDYIKSLLTSPLNIGTHEQNTNEENKFVDGWVTDSWFDEDKKQAMVKAVIIGQKEIDYVKEHKDDKGFGASGFITFDDYTKDDTGNMTLKKITNQHIAITENVRDPELKIYSMNSQDAAIREAKSKVDLQIMPVTDENKRNQDSIKNEEESNMTPEEIKKYVLEAMSETKDAEATNAEMVGMKKDIDEIKNSLSALIGKKEEEEISEEAGAANTEEEDKAAEEKAASEKAAAENVSGSNALVSDKLLASIAEKTGMVFNAKTTLNDLKNVFELKEEKPLDILKAVNAIVIDSESAQNSESNETKFKGSILELM